MITLAGGASTDSRASRPLPCGAVRGMTCAVAGVREYVEFTYGDGSAEDRELLSWVVGQAGLLWGGGPYPFPLAPGDLTHGSYGHIAEYDLADTLGEVFDGKLSSNDLAVRFFSNGGDACAAAVRIARAVTARDVIATQGYHGAQSDFAHQPAWFGYPYENVRLHRRFEFGDSAGMAQAARDAACIMVEVPGLDDEQAIMTFLENCRSKADQWIIPFIIDDVVGGFRFALGGTAERYGVKPDMICLGKAMSATGGISALIGRADLVGKLGGEVFYSTTFGGAPDRCQIANDTIRWLMNHRGEVYGESGHLHIIGQALKDGLNALGVPCVGQPERSALNFPTNTAWLDFCSRMIERGVMMHRPNFVTLAHSMRDVDETLAAAERVVKELQTA